MPPYIGDQDLWSDDRALQKWTDQQGANWASDHLAGVGRQAG
ncbi:MAG: hypothetical protein ABJP25_17340, partial [Sneathiella sp.]